MKPAVYKVSGYYLVRAVDEEDAMEHDLIDFNVTEIKKYDKEAS
jgi:hypothetical protein